MKLLLSICLIGLFSASFAKEKNTLSSIKLNVLKIKELNAYHWNKKMSEFTKKSKTSISKDEIHEIIEYLKNKKWLKVSEQKTQIPDEPAFALKSDNNVSINVYVGIKRFEIDGYYIYYSKNEKLKVFARKHSK